MSRQTSTSLFLVLAIFFLGLACDYQPAWWPPPLALVELGIGLVFTLAAVVAPAFALRKRLLSLVLFVTIGLQLALLATRLPLGLWIYPILVLTLVFAFAVVSTERYGLWLLGIPIVAYIVVGIWVIHAAPQPFIDVWIFERDGVKALASGENPYTLTFPNIFRNDAFYGAGLVENGRLQFGFPYPPINLLFEMLGTALGGDVRFGHLISAAAAAALIGTLPRRDNLEARAQARAAAVLYLSTPSTFFILKHAWIEPVVVLLLALAVWARRWPKVFPYMLGLFFASKQYLLLAVPVTGLFERRSKPWLLLMAKAGLVVLATALPFLLWNAPAFLFDIVTLQFRQPFRPDGLSFLAQMAADEGPSPALLGLSFILALVGSAVALRVTSATSKLAAPATDSAFAAALALVFFLFFAFNKQAFPNYYNFVLGALAVALATVPG